MPQFMLILKETPGAYKKLSPEEIQQMIQKYRAWAGKLAQAGKLGNSHKLMDEGGKIVATKNGRFTVVDGPYSEAKEVVGGYFIITAKDYAEAIELVRDHPHVPMGTIDIREVDPMTGAQ